MGAIGKPVRELEVPAPERFTIPQFEPSEPKVIPLPVEEPEKVPA